MMFHTAMIILHRPPRHLFQNPDIAHSEDIEYCYESLQAIVRLLRIYSRHYQYNKLPLTFVHTLASAASVILMKRYIDGTSWDDDTTVSRPLDLVLEAIDGISQTWTCARQVRDVIKAAMQNTNQENTRHETPESFDFMAGLMDPSSGNAGNDFLNLDMNAGMDGVDFGAFVTDDLVDGGIWDEGMFQQIDSLRGYDSNDAVSADWGIPLHPQQNLGP